MPKFTGEIQIQYPDRDPKDAYTIDTNNPEIVGEFARKYSEGANIIIEDVTESGIIIPTDTANLPEGTLIVLPVED